METPEQEVLPQKPPRPYDPNRLAAMSKPKPVAEDPSIRLPPKPKKVARATRQYLQDRAARVKSRQDATEKKPLALTDGSTPGVAPSDQSARRRNIIQNSREINNRSLRKRSNSTKRSDAGRSAQSKKTVFDRLAEKKAKQ